MPAQKKILGELISYLYLSWQLTLLVLKKGEAKAVNVACVSTLALALKPALKYMNSV